MGSESRLTLDEPRRELRWSGSDPDYASWIQTVAGRWQHAVRCATCRGLKPVRGNEHSVAPKPFRYQATAGEVR